MARKSKKSEWEKTLSLMSLDELYYILSTPDAYEAGYVQMAKEKLDDLADLTEHEAMKAPESTIKAIISLFFIDRVYVFYVFLH